LVGRGAGDLKKEVFFFEKNQKDYVEPSGAKEER
jgi:hypothetical protein